MAKNIVNNVRGPCFRIKKSYWLQHFIKLSIEGHKLHFFQEIDKKNSLNWYRMFKRSTFVEHFAGTMLKLLVRTGCFGLGEALERWVYQMDNVNYVIMQRQTEDLPIFYVFST